MPIENTMVSGPLFVTGAVVVFVVLGKLVWSMWARVDERLDQAKQKLTEPRPGLIAPILVTLVVASVYIVAVTLGWTFLQRKTTTMSNYQSPAERAEQKMVQETTPPTADEIEAKREAQKNEEEKTHEEARAAFDESMEREAEKIRQRSEDD